MSAVLLRCGISALSNFDEDAFIVMAASGASNSVTRSGISGADITLTDEAAQQALTALAAAAGGNVTGASSQFAQNLVVNYLQQQGAAYIGDLVRQGSVAEGSPVHATLHAIVACAGAIAGSQSCGSGALGAAASSLLTNLFLDTPNESAEQKEAKRNLIATLVAGIAAAADNALPTATNAAIAATDNNYLTQQDVEYLAGELRKCAATNETCRKAVADEAKKRSDRNDEKLKACRTTECVENLMPEIFAGAWDFGLIYAADQAIDNKEKLAFGRISDIETYSLLLAANMAAGLRIYPSSDMNWNDLIAKAENFEFTPGAGDKTGWQKITDFYENHAGDTSQPHEYRHLGLACYIQPGANCGTLSQQFDALLRYAGPGTDGKSLADNGVVSHLNIGFSFGSVTHLIDPSTGSVINITLPGAHPLHPGFVVRQIIPAGDSGFYVETKGWGTGSSPMGNSNTWAAGMVWGPNTQNIGGKATVITNPMLYMMYQQHLRGW